MGKLQIDVPQAELAEFCERNHIRKLSFFGSVTREDFNDDSDIDVLVEFDPDHVPGLAFVGMKFELQKLFGKSIDLYTPGFFSEENFAQLNEGLLTGYAR